MEVEKNTLYKLILAILLCINAQNALAEIDCDLIYEADMQQCEDIYNDWSCGISITCAIQRQSFWMDCSGESTASYYQCKTEQAKKIANIYKEIIETTNKTTEIYNQTTEIYNETAEKYMKAAETYDETAIKHNETIELYNKAIEYYNQAADNYNNIND